MNWKEFLLWFSIVFVSLCAIVGAVRVDTSSYSISCFPDVDSIHSFGFRQFCSYTWKAAGNYSGDVAFCFDSSLTSGSLQVINDNSSLTDITSLFQYKNFNMTKGDCYYIKNITFNSNKTINTMITYLPSNVSMSHKWDTYFGNIATSRVDLRLDPIYNTSLYSIGGISSSTYYWNNSGVINSDIASYTSSDVNHSLIMTQSYVTTNATNINNLADWSTLYQSAGSQSGTLVANITGFNVFIDNITTYTAASWAACGGIGNYTFKQFFNDGFVYNWTGGVGGYPGTATSYIYPSRNSNTNYFELYLDDTSCSLYTKVQFRFQYGYNSTQRCVAPCTITSNYISMPILVRYFQMNNTFQNAAFINISFSSNDSNYLYLNLSNSSLINISQNYC